MADDSKDDGGAAFRACGPSLGRDGMSLRDWFAGQALVGIAETFIGNYDADFDDVNVAIATAAYAIADAMILARGE